MISSALARAFARRDVHYGWAVVAATFLTMLTVAGAVGAPGVFLLPLQREFGWSTSEISVAMAIRLLLFGLMGPFAAAFINRFGVRKVVLTSLTLIASALAVSLGMTQVWQLILLWGVVIGFGTGMTAMVLGATVATRWFSARRGLVVGMLTASSATGQLIFMPLLSNLSASHGWRTALTLMIGLIAFAAVAILAVMRDRPSDVGLNAYGEAGPAAPPPASPATSVVAAAIGALREASRNRMFWVLFFSFYVCGASTNGLVQTHLIPLCADFGVAETNAAGMLAVIGAFDFVGTIVSGWLSDRYDNRWLLFWYYGLRGLSLVYLPFSDFTFYGLSIFAVFYGLDWVATVPPTVKLTADRFGREKANLVFGWVFAGHQMGAATAAFGAGLTRSTLDTYLPAFFVAGALCVLTALMFATVGSRKPAAVGAVAD